MGQAKNKRVFRPRLDIADRNLLIPGEVVDARIVEMGHCVSEFIASSVNPVVLAAVLTGGVPFCMDLCKHLHPNYRVAYLHASRYGGSEHGNDVTFKYSTLGNVKGHTVIIVDDIGDGRNTLDYLTRFVLLEGAAQVKTCVLLNKPSRKEADVPLDWVGFNIPNVFVWGRGLDGGNATQATRNDYDVCHFGSHPGGANYTIPTQLPC